MEVVRPSFADTLAQRRTAVHVQHVRSLAQSDPAIIAGLIEQWMGEDAPAWRLPSPRRRAVYWPTRLR